MSQQGDLREESTKSGGSKADCVSMSQQGDLREESTKSGGYNPDDFLCAVQALKNDFLQMFPIALDSGKNAKFLKHIDNCFSKKHYEDLLTLMIYAQEKIVNLLHSKINKPESPKETEVKAEQWKELGIKLESTQKQIQQSKTAPTFKFVEGNCDYICKYFFFF